MPFYFVIIPSSANQ